MVAVGGIGIVLGVLLTIATANPLTLILIALAAAGVYGLMIALPTFIYNHYVKPRQIREVLDILSEKSPLISEINRVIELAHPTSDTPGIVPYRDPSYSSGQVLSAAPPVTPEPTPNPTDEKQQQHSKNF
jgi:hypothetical protein